MATKAQKERAKQKLLHRGGIALLKASGSAVMGATIGVVEEAAGERAALGTKAVMAAAGLASEILVDPEKNPALAEIGKSALHSPITVTAYEAAKSGTRKGLDMKAEHDQKKLIDAVRRDMEADPRTSKKNGVNGVSDVVEQPAQKRRQRKQRLATNADETETETET